MGLSGWGELRKRKTKEGLIWGSRKSAGGVRGNSQLGESCGEKGMEGEANEQVAMAMKQHLSNIHSFYGSTMRILATVMSNGWD